MTTIDLGGQLVGAGQPCFVIAEIGINHNGDMALARKLVELAADAGCATAKGQKRTVDVVYGAEELSRARDSVFGPTNGHLKRGLELSLDDHRELAEIARSRGISWTASAWDPASVDDVASFDPPFFKIASASLTDDALLRHHQRYDLPIVLSTGMSSLPEVDHAVEVLGTDRLVLLHCTSTYPAADEELNLRAIPVLRERYGVPVGYSGHERGIAATLAAVALGACVVERHVTLDRGLWGSDQSASLEPDELERLVQEIVQVERALGDGHKRVYGSEVPVREKLRRVG